MIKNPKELKPGQIVVAPPTKEVNKGWRDASYARMISWRYGTVKKHISGVPHPGVFISWDNGLGLILEYNAVDCWEEYYVVNTDQERLALMMKLS
jgi:hypothetical protein